MKKKLKPSVCSIDKIKSYMESVSVKIPLPVKCTIEERKGRKHAKLHFACQVIKMRLVHK
jgi:hypothetical protein